MIMRTVSLFVILVLLTIINGYIRADDAISPIIGKEIFLEDNNAFGLVIVMKYIVIFITAVVTICYKLLRKTICKDCRGT